jgi:hypothetical protein
MSLLAFDKNSVYLVACKCYEREQWKKFDEVIPSAEELKWVLTSSKSETFLQETWNLNGNTASQRC